MNKYSIDLVFELHFLICLRHSYILSNSFSVLCLRPSSIHVAGYTVVGSFCNTAEGPLLTSGFVGLVYDASDFLLQFKLMKVILISFQTILLLVI